MAVVGRARGKVVGAAGATLTFTQQGTFHHMNATGFYIHVPYPDKQEASLSKFKDTFSQAKALRKATEQDPVDGRHVASKAMCVLQKLDLCS